MGLIEESASHSKLAIDHVRTYLGSSGFFQGKFCPPLEPVSMFALVSPCPLPEKWSLSVTSFGSSGTGAELA